MSAETIFPIVNDDVDDNDSAPRPRIDLRNAIGDAPPRLRVYDLRVVNDGDYGRSSTAVVGALVVAPMLAWGGIGGIFGIAACSRNPPTQPSPSRGALLVSAAWGVVGSLLGIALARSLALRSAKANRAWRALAQQFVEHMGASSTPHAATVIQLPVHVDDQLADKVATYVAEYVGRGNTSAAFIYMHVWGRDADAEKQSVKAPSAVVFVAPKTRTVFTLDAREPDPTSDLAFRVGKKLDPNMTLVSKTVSTDDLKRNLFDL